MQRELKQVQEIFPEAEILFIETYEDGGIVKNYYISIKEYFIEIYKSYFDDIGYTIQINGVNYPRKKNGIGAKDFNKILKVLQAIKDCE